MKGIIFDLGGTLTYFDGNWEQVDQQSMLAMMPFLNENGIRVGDDFPQQFLAARRRGWEQADKTGVESRMAEALGETLAQFGYPSADSLLQRAADIYFEFSNSGWHAFPDALETMQALQQRHFRIGLISNADDIDLVHRAVQRLGFASFMSPVISSAEDPRWRKPNPRIFHRVSEAWNLPPHEIVMVGDSPRYDVLGGHRAGMSSILIDRGTNLWFQRITEELARDPLIYADATVKALAEIPSVLDSWLV